MLRNATSRTHLLRAISLIRLPVGHIVFCNKIVLIVCQQLSSRALLVILLHIFLPVNHILPLSRPIEELQLGKTYAGLLAMVRLSLSHAGRRNSGGTADQILSLG